MQTPAAYTLLGISLALGAVAVVGFGGVHWWYLWETTFNDRTEEQYGASASCSDPVGSNDPLGVGMDLVLSQDAYTDQVTVSGLIIGGGVQEGIGLRLRLSSDESCTPDPTSFTEGTIVSPTTDDYVDVDWTLPGYRLDGTGSDIVGKALVIQSPRGAVQACCVITSLPGAESTSTSRRRGVESTSTSRRRRAVPPARHRRQTTLFNMS